MLLGTVVYSKLVTMPENKTKRTWKVFHSVDKSVKTLTPSYSYFQQLHVRGFFSRRDAHFPPEYPGLD
ncbi:hypothetical protein KC19_9G022700 [Ceratodon purpureus]|uniref:Uncharacterized protein n=1 Tax=Ceratodon purpureus TaxID=3225 RepID=A0A8T0GPP9_CERPU|nr:hypothetical protein KC19_9G022700 [Ceratodon purpureus]